MATSTSTSIPLKEYLKRYGNDDKKEQKKKKKKSRKTKKDAVGVLVVDEDPVWQKPIKLADEEDEEDSADEEKPQVNEDIEVKRMKRMEQIRSQRPYNAISEDGSGWISVSDAPKHSSFMKRSPDVSPSRERRTRYDTPSPESDLNPTKKDPDMSPPRQHRRRFHTPSPEPELKQSNSISPDQDLSPPRHSRSQNVSDLKRKNPDRTDSPDISPPRRGRPRSPNINASRASQEADLSPPRKSRKGTGRSLSPDISPPRRGRPHSPNINASRASQEADLSPPRKSRKGPGRSESPDLSPPRRVRHLSPGGDAAGNSLVSDLSPPRKSKKDASSLKEGPRAGLFSAQEIKKELDRKRKEELSRFKAMDPTVSGRGAQPVYRDKEGKRISKEEVLKLQKGEEKPKEKKLEWGKGLVQKRDAEAREHDLEAEKDKPFARTRDDPDLDNMLKERIRWGDPMAHLVKRKQPELALGNLGDDDKMKESGFLIPQDIPNHSWIKRRIEAAPNRYGIRPGRHWDGVDRSNGTEKEFFKRMNEKQATEKEAYLWSVSDM